MNTPIISFVFRRLGAKIGDGVVLHGASIVEPDLLTIDSSAYIGFNADLRCHSFEKGGTNLKAAP